MDETSEYRGGFNKLREAYSRTVDDDDNSNKRQALYANMKYL